MGGSYNKSLSYDVYAKDENGNKAYGYVEVENSNAGLLKNTKRMRNLLLKSKHSHGVKKFKKLIFQKKNKSTSKNEAVKGAQSSGGRSVQQGSVSYARSGEQVSTDFKALGAKEYFMSSHLPLRKLQKDNLFERSKKEEGNKDKMVASSLAQRLFGRHGNEEEWKHEKAEENESGGKWNEENKITDKTKRREQLIWTARHMGRKKDFENTAKLIAKLKRSNGLNSVIVPITRVVDHAQKIKNHVVGVQGETTSYAEDEDAKKNKIGGGWQQFAEKAVINDKRLKASKALLNPFYLQNVTKKFARQKRENTNGLHNRHQKAAWHLPPSPPTYSTKQSPTYSTTQLSKQSMLFHTLATSLHSSRSLQFYSFKRPNDTSRPSLSPEPDLILRMNVARNATATVYAYKPPKMQKLVQCCYKSSRKEYDSRGECMDECMRGKMHEWVYGWMHG